MTFADMCLTRDYLHVWIKEADGASAAASLLPPSRKSIKGDQVTTGFLR